VIQSSERAGLLLKPPGVVGIWLGLVEMEPLERHRITGRRIAA